MQYMYLGESQALTKHLDSFLEVGEELAVCGLRRREEDTPGGQDMKTKKKTQEKEKHDSSEGQEKAGSQAKEAAKMNGIAQNETIHQTTVEPLSFMELVATPKKFACDRCKIQFSSLNTLKIHPCNITEAKFECKVCPFKFQLENLLKMHIEEKHSGKPERVFKPRKRRSDAINYVKNAE